MNLAPIHRLASCVLMAATVATARAQVAAQSKEWALEPLSKPSVPDMHHAREAQSPIDAFVLSALDERGLKPAPPADKRTLIRRVYFDLVGIPPTPEEVAAFVSDESPTAYEKVVDRLLASPRYGERWARHWMDIVHFAETHGHDEDRERPNAWPYRDYLIESFNDDKPFGRFIEEQVAGDALYPDDPQATVALGFLAAGPWDESSHMGIRDDTTDKKVAQYLDRDDMIQTTVCTFDSVTVGCARCHDHKFDPISQRDYYGLQAVFAGVDRADRPYDPDPKIHALRQRLLREKRGLETGNFATGASPADAAAQADAERWAQDARARASRWTVLVPQTCASANGSTLSPQPDGSITSKGARPDVDTYTITAVTSLRGITAVRLELLTDDNLPHKGPGRQDNGNLHLNEFTLKAAPASDPPAAQAMEIAAAKADFDQQGWTVAMSIDHKPGTAWGIFPEVGKPHAAVFELKEPINSDGDVVLTFGLEQTHGGGHLIGRFRLSVTAAPLPAPVQEPSLPPSIETIVQLAPAQRTDAQRLELTRYVLTSKIEEQLKALPSPQWIYAATGAFEAQGNFKPPTGPRPVFVLHRGDINQPVEPARPGALRCVPGLEAEFHLAEPENESSRRAALAKWLSDPKNCLTWRSIVNRVWQYHFGRGLVATPNDFGRMGSRPSHPQLLDWLACELLEHDGSLKHLHRLIVTSNTYRQSTRLNPAAAKIDADNQLLWRMNRIRLDAECVRDAILQGSGLLDTSMGGPSAKQFTQKPGIHLTPVLDYAAFDLDSPAARRLSVYRFVWRTLPDPFMNTLDCPDASELTPVRNTSVTALQALAMFNDRFVIRYSQHLAERLTRERATLPEQIERMYELCLNRQPTKKESAAVSQYATRRGLANACRILLNSSEFLFLN